MIRLNPATRNCIQIQKLSISFFIFVLLILAVVLPASSSFVGITGIQIRGEFKEDSLFLAQGPGEIESDKDLAKGTFLVAGRKLNDPNFHQTVVLLIRYGPDGATGLVINRPLNVKLATVLPDFKESEHRNEALYLGGPVERNKMLLLLRSAKPPPDSMPVFGDVYISSSREELKRLIKSTNKDEKFRIYAGYAGWAPGQLESERTRGDWHVLKAEVKTLFDKKSSETWPELIHRFTVNWVRWKNIDLSGVQRFRAERLEDQVQF